MKRTKILMGMPITIEIVDDFVGPADIDETYAYFRYIDQKFSTYKSDSEISLINQGQLNQSQASPDMQTVFRLSSQTKQQTNGFFDIERSGRYDPSGLVKGWAIWQAAKLLLKKGFHNFYIDAGGDIQSFGLNKNGRPWQVGIRHPFQTDQIVKVVEAIDRGIATSGTYIRGNHIYNPKTVQAPGDDIVSLTIIGPNIYEADRFATAAFAMGRSGIGFIEQLIGFEGYMIDQNGLATFTSGFDQFTRP